MLCAHWQGVEARQAASAGSSTSSSRGHGFTLYNTSRCDDQVAELIAPQLAAGSISDLLDSPAAMTATPVRAKHSGTASKQAGVRTFTKH